jgi:hypothetical protein
MGCNPTLRGSDMAERNARSSRRLYLPPDLQFPARASELRLASRVRARVDATYVQQEDEASLTAFSMASRVSPVRF